MVQRGCQLIDRGGLLAGVKLEAFRAGPVGQALCLNLALLAQNNIGRRDHIRDLLRRDLGQLVRWIIEQTVLRPFVSGVGVGVRAGCNELLTVR